MNANSRLARNHSSAPRGGFTLVEMLVVIVIIGILMGLALPAIMSARKTAIAGAIRTEVEGLDQAINVYNTKYGDYPPDFMSWAIAARHYRKAFPNIANSELLLLQRACDDSIANDSDESIAISGHDPTKIDRAEALYWALGGFSSDPQFPFTGSGGPLQYIPPASPTALSPVMPANYQLNTGRSTPLFEFEAGSLTIAVPDATLPLSATNRTQSNDELGTAADPWDLFPICLNSKNGPFVYFDSRTYTAFDTNPTTNKGFNGYGHVNYGAIRPFVSDQPVLKTGSAAYGSPAASLTAWEFINPNTFQILTCGLDGTFGTNIGFDIDASGSIDSTEPLYFQYPSGNAIVANAAATAPADLVVPAYKRFQNQTDRNLDEEGQIDNITNFSKSMIIDDVKG